MTVPADDRSGRIKHCVVALIVLVVVSMGVFASFAYLKDMRVLRERISTSVGVVETSRGPMAFSTGGNGNPVLAIHGAGGGHDQGRLLGVAFLPAGFRWIAPSRFGYLGSPLPSDASTAAQADAFAELLDKLGLDRVTILAMSGGAPPALQFALRHPNRTEALVLISPAPYAPLSAEDQRLPVPNWFYEAVFASDVPLWALLKVFPRALASMFDARSDLIARMSVDEAAFLDAMITAFLPVTERRRGLANEGAAIHPSAAIDPSAIAVPVLIIHARDDRIAPFSTAEFTAERIPGAQLLSLGSGGHLLLGQHAAVRQRIAEFLGRNDRR